MMADGSFPRLVGGRICLDFVNTADWSPAGGLLKDTLVTAADVAVWCRAVGLDAASSRHGTLAELRAFRAALRRLLLRAIEGGSAAPNDLAPLNAALQSMEAPVLCSTGDGYGFGSGVKLEQAVAVSAAGLLARAEDRVRLKYCPGEDCGWMFLDESRNRRRTWCAMDMCGNRAKARRHYRRKIGRAPDGA